jgi:nicotinamide mononucleotide transporter
MLDNLIQPIGILVANPLECVANIVYAVSVWLAARNNVHTWWIGIVGCVLFGVLFFLSQLYADVTLQVFFIGTSCLGWWQWVRGNAGNALTVQRSTPSFLFVRAVLALAVAAVYGSVLYRFTDAFAPYIDSLVLTFSVLAQLLMMQRRIENWSAWLIVNSIAIPLYLSRELYVTAFFYGIYWCNVMYGLSYWRKELAKA